MEHYNDIGISARLDWPRIRRLLKIGLLASVLHVIGDMSLGWGLEDEALTGLERMLSAYTGTSDGGIFAAALLGLLGVFHAGGHAAGDAARRAGQSAACQCACLRLDCSRQSLDVRRPYRHGQ